MLFKEKKMKKKLFTCLLAILLLAGTLPVYATTLSVTESKSLINGVTYTHMERLSGTGWQDIYVVQADLNEPHLKFDVLSRADGKSYLQNTYDSAVDADAVAAINADFFSSKRGESGRGSAIGIEISDGILKTSPAAYEDMNVLYQPKEDETLYFNHFTYDFKVTAPSGESENIVVINKYDDLRGIVMYTPAWGKTTPGSGSDVLEVVVTDGIVTAKNYNNGSVEIPENGYVLASNITINNFLDTKLAVGDEVTVDIATLPDFNNLKTAVGGGGLILVDGKVPDTFSHTITGAQPRSAVGTDKTGKIITLVAVDGRRSGAAGMTQTQLGYLMAELGCFNAMNLDGGGSTLLTVKDETGHRVANQPSDGSKRAVTNSVGILLDEPANPVLSAVRLTPDDPNMFAGTRRWLKFEGLDQYGRILHDSITEPVAWTVLEGNAVIEDDMLIAETPGIVKIQGTYGDFHDITTVTVLDVPYRLSTGASEIKASVGDSKALWVTGWDARGQHALIYPTDLQMTVKNPSVARMQGNSLQAVANGSTVVTAAFGEVSTSLAFTVGNAETASIPKNTVKPDAAQKAPDISNKNSFTFTVFGNTRTPEKLFDLYIMNGVVNAVKAESDMNYFVGNSVNTKILKDLGKNLKTANGYSRIDYRDNAFITLKNSYGKTLFGTDETQWEKLRNDIENLQAENLFVFLNDHNISSLPVEITVFKKLMAEAAQKCSHVYVFAGGYVNETVIEDGVRYITTAGVFPSIGLKPPATNISYIKYYAVTVDGDKVTYETKGIIG